MTRGLDVVDLHEEPGSLAALEVLVLRRLARASATPLVFYSAQNIFKRYPRPFRWIERLALKTASGAYVCNLDAKSVLERKGFGGLIEVIPLGVDPDLFRPSSSPGATAAPLTVGYAGRLEEHKGVSVLLRAIGILEDVELRIVGDGSEAANLMSLAAELGIAGRVSFERFAGRESMADFYRSIDLLAVPSLVRPNWVEQFGRVAAEAMAAGTPIVAAASGSLPEVVGNAGILVAPEDPSALAAAIDSLQDAGRRQELAAAAALRGRTFAWGEVARAHLGLYQAVARPRVASPHTS
jgi:glycosyltransferase involved in cell wall biosynthesis